MHSHFLLISGNYNYFLLKIYIEYFIRSRRVPSQTRFTVQHVEIYDLSTHRSVAVRQIRRVYRPSINTNTYYKIIIVNVGANNVRARA